MKKARSGRRVNATGRSTKPDRFLQLSHFLLASAAWRSLDPVARSLFVEVAQRYTGFNNGSIGLGVREAGVALHVKPETAGKAFKALQDRGFLVLQRESSFDQKRLAREWRLTIFPMGDCRAPTAPPTKDYVRWQPDQKQKLEPFGGTHRAVMEHDHGQKCTDGQIQYPKTALSGRIGRLHRAVWGYTSSYQGEVVPR
jgi:hypothetical protein